MGVEQVMKLGRGEHVVSAAETSGRRLLHELRYSTAQRALDSGGGPRREEQTVSRRVRAQVAEGDVLTSLALSATRTAGTSNCGLREPP